MGQCQNSKISLMIDAIVGVDPCMGKAKQSIFSNQTHQPLPYFINFASRPFTRRTSHRECIREDLHYSHLSSCIGYPSN
jgi:hypothetical protein